MSKTMLCERGARILRLLGLVCCAVGVLEGSAQAEELAERWLPRAVRIMARFKGEPSRPGFGIILGEREGTLYVVTADHVVRTEGPEPTELVGIDVELQTSQGDLRPGKLLARHEPAPRDLAVLTVAGRLSQDKLCADVEGLVRNTPAKYIGREGEWYIPTTPGLVNRSPNGDDLFKVDFGGSVGVEVGTSGAPVLSDQGLLGMVVRDNSSQVATALSIQYVQKIFREWNFPWALDVCARRPSAAQVEVRAPAPGEPGMVQLPGGRFKMGSTDGDADEKPVHDVLLSPFSIDRTEVTVAEYRKCVDAGKCTAPGSGTFCNWKETGRGNHPINCVTWDQADRYCRAFGKRLPTEAEWEFAARGPQGRKYPWASPDKPANQLCWDGEGSDLGKGKRHSTCPVGAYPSGATPEGIQDMAGNVWEWTADWSGPYPNEQRTDSGGPLTGTARVVRGGSWNDFDPSWFRGADRSWDVHLLSYFYLGFRCARGVKTP